MIIGKLQYNNSFSEVERELAQYILEHPESVVEMNIRQLALVSYSSPATITRLCRKIGAKGFTDFKVKLSGELHSQEKLNYLVDVNVPFQPEDSMEEIAKKLAGISLDSIRSTRESFHYGRMENIVRCIMKSSVVDVYGEGDSLYAAFEFKNKMMRIRRQVRIETVSYTHLQEKTPEEMETILAERKKLWKGFESKYTKGILKLFAQHAVSAMRCV